MVYNAINGGEDMNIKINDIVINSRKRKLNENKVKELAESMKLIGQLEPITVTSGNVLLAGLHRVEAAKILGWDEIKAELFEGNELECELAEIDENLMRNDLTVLEQGEHLARRQELIGYKQGDNRFTIDRGETVSPLKTTAEIAHHIGLTERSAQQRIQAARNIVPEVKDAIRDTEIANSTTQLLELARLSPDKQIEVSSLLKGETTIQDALKIAKKVEREKEIQDKIIEIESNAFIPPSRKYDVIVIDPPWPYGTEYDPDGRRSASPYPEMSLEDIAGIQLPAADDCILWLWTTHKFMRYSFAILDKWGFRDVAILTWVKSRMGLGSWLRSQTEYCIMAVKGHPKINLTNQTTVIHGDMREHSRKPDEFYKLVDSLCVGYKIDWFSREKREGWDQYGIETDRFVAK